VDPDAGAAFIRAWERAVFSDVASALAAELRTGFNPREAIDDEVRDRFVRTLESATALSGARPSDLYAVEELVPLSLEWSPLARIGLRVRYWLQDHRWIAVGAILPATALALLFGIFWMHVAVWRGFLVGGSWYLRELRAASSVPTRPPGPPA
jgi:hypothetical protein